MLKSRLFTALAVTLALGAAACGDAEEPEVVEEPVNVPSLDQPVEVDPAVMEGAILMDTSMVGTPVDTTM